EPVASSTWTVAPHRPGAARDFGRHRMAAAKMDPGRTKLPDRQYRARHHFLAHCFASGQPPGFHMASSLPFHLSELADDKAEKRHPVKGTPATLCSFLCVLLLRMPSAFS